MSLWLEPQRKPVRVGLERFASYEYFLDALTQYVDLSVPPIVTVRWEPYKIFTAELIDVEDEGQAAELQEFIDSVTQRISAGEDVPPLVRNGRSIFDGRHRAFAAEQLGIKVAPVIDVAPFWKRRSGARKS